MEEEWNKLFLLLRSGINLVEEEGERDPEQRKILLIMCARARNANVFLPCYSNDLFHMRSVFSLA